MKNNLDNLIFSNCINQFIDDHRLLGRLPKTIIFYKNELSLFDRWLDKNGLDKNIESITSAILRKWFTDLSTHRNRGGICCNYRAIKAIFNWIYSQYELENNPIKKVKIQSNHIEPLPEYPLEDCQRLLNACHKKNELRNKAIIIFLADTGCRATEVTVLNIGDVNLITGSVKVLGKGNRTRIVWIGEKCRQTLKQYLKSRINLQDNQPLFLNSFNHRMTYLSLRMIIKKLCNIANVQFRSTHSFRRLFALTMYRKTHDILLVSRLLGHQGTSVTLRYLNLSNEDLQTAHENNSPVDNLIL